VSYHFHSSLYRITKAVWIQLRHFWFSTKRLSYFLAAFPENHWFLSMGMYYEGGAVITHKARLLIACGGGGRFASTHPCPTYNQMHTVCKMDLILRPIERRPQMQFSMARRFKLQLLRRYSVKFYKMRNITLGPPWLDKLKNTGGRRTSILWICSLWLYHCATATCDTRAEF
jgi:hypothetical protein